jgi:multidrug efflux system membrane fusion protein
MGIRRHLWPAVAGALALALVALAVAWGSRRGPDAALATAPAPSASGPVAVVDGTTVVRLGLAAQRRSGLRAEPLAPAAPPAGTVTYGTVMDLRPLVDWASKLSGAAARAQAAQAQAGADEAEVERTRALYRDDRNASLKSLQAAQATAEQAKANADAAAAALDALRSEGRLQFGPSLADDTARHPGAVPRDGRLAVVRVAMRPGAAAPRCVEVAYGSAQRHRARWLSPAPQADAQLGADVQLYEVDRALPAHASVTVYLCRSASGSPGVFVPLPAVVWYADQPWVYVLRDDTHFARVALPDARELPQGFFASEGLQPGQKVVTRGAGLLLSQEQIPPPGSSTACKDPECDD